MVAMPPVPNPNNFLYLLKIAIDENKDFSYRINIKSVKCFYINLEVAKTMYDVLKNKIPAKRRSMLIKLAPNNMTALTMFCLE